MNLIVFGATGGTGRHVLAQALSAGHTVTAVARRPELLNETHEQLHVVRGDVFEPATFMQALAGQDAVVSALGVRSQTPTTLFSAGVGQIMCAMHMHGVNRLVCISAGGLDPGPLIARLFAKPILWRLFRHSYTDLTRMETSVKASNLNWTIIHPPRLTNGPRTGHYQVAVNTHLQRGWSISRADLADYIVAHISDPTASRAVIEIAT